MTNQQTLRCTVHWFDHDQPQQRDLLFVDQPIGELGAVLIDSFGLSSQAHAAQLSLRPSPRAAAWPPHRTLRDVGVRDGDHLWLTGTTSVRPVAIQANRWMRRTSVQCTLVVESCLITLPPAGQEITRTWLLTQLPQQRRLYEQARFFLRRSSFQTVSASSAHCRVIPGGGTWVVETVREDVETHLNKQRLNVGRPYALNDGDRLQLGGLQGLLLTVMLTRRDT